VDRIIEIKTFRTVMLISGGAVLDLIHFHWDQCLSIRPGAMRGNSRNSCWRGIWGGGYSLGSTAITAWGVGTSTGTCTGNTTLRDTGYSGFDNNHAILTEESFICIQN